MNLEHFLDYHERSVRIGDVDPQNACLSYISRRYELNVEQCFWLAFLFGCTYSAPTTFYIYNEFPDFENVDEARLARWWEKNKHRCLFQTDRLRVKTQNLLVETFRSYRALVGERTQYCAFMDSAGAQGVSGRTDAYRAAWNWAIQIKNFGRFSLFIYLELIHELTPYKMSPDKLDVANALSSRNGLCYVLGRENLIDMDLNPVLVIWLEDQFKFLVREANSRVKSNAWSLETTLCAYKKHCRNKKRWVGYYLDRQHKEISKLEDSVQRGVDWSMLWQYREETYNGAHLLEKTGKPSSFEEPYECESFS